MEITLEQVERLREKADVSYAQAKEALEYSGGNLLDALIYLEERGMIPRPEGAYYSTRGGTSPQPASAADSASQGGERKEKKEKKKKGGSMEVVVVKPERGAVRGLLHTLRRWLIENELEIWRKDKPVTALPVLILVLLVICAPWVVLPALVLGLFLGFRYRFSGPDLERDELNDMMGTVADTAADIGHKVMEELKHDWHSDEPGRQDRNKGREE